MAEFDMKPLMGATDKVTAAYAAALETLNENDHRGAAAAWLCGAHDSALAWLKMCAEIASARTGLKVIFQEQEVIHLPEYHKDWQNCRQDVLKEIERRVKENK